MAGWRMEPFEDTFPIEDGYCFHCHVNVLWIPKQTTWMVCFPQGGPLRSSYKLGEISPIKWAESKRLCLSYFITLLIMLPFITIVGGPCCTKMFIIPIVCLLSAVASSWQSFWTLDDSELIPQTVISLTKMMKSSGRKGSNEHQPENDWKLKK